jgi:D-xylose transport system permease protein
MRVFLRKNGAWIGFFALVIIFTIATDAGFLSSRNLTNLVRQASINGILAAGMTMIILTSGIDLSIGSVVALAGVVAGVSQVNWEWASMGLMGAFGSIGIAVLIGLLAGVVTGGLVAWLGIPPFVITLGMMVICRGLALIVSNGAGISPMGDSLRPIGGEYLSIPATLIISGVGLLIYGYRMKNKWKEALLPLLVFCFFIYSFVDYKGFPIPVVILLFVLSFVGFMLSHTTIGRCIYAVGSNEQAAHWAGVPTKKVKAFVYIFMGLLAGLSGVLLAGRLNSAVPTAGQLFELDAIAAVVIGGTSLKGGVGSVMGSFVGALTIATLDNGMDLLSIPSFYQMLLKGLIIIVAVSLDKGQRSTT